MPSIGSIFVDFVARTAGFQQGVQQAASQVEQAGGRMEQSNAKTGESSQKMAAVMSKSFLQVVVGAHAFTLVRREIQDVMKDIESIPGVPAETIASIERMKYSFESANGVLKPAIATMMGWFQNLGEGIGYMLGQAAYGIDATTDAFEKMNAEAAKFASARFDADFAKLQTEMDRLKLTSGELAAALLEEAAALEATNPATKQEGWDAALKAGKDRIEAQKLINALRKELTAEGKVGVDFADKFSIAGMGIDKAIATLKEKFRDLQAQRRALKGGDYDAVMQDPVALEQAIAIQKAMNKTEDQIISLTKKVKEAGAVMRDSFASAFGSMSDEIAAFVVDGKTSFGDFFRSLEKQLLSTFLKLSLLNPIMNRMFKNVSGWSALPAFFGFASGGKPPVGQASLIGEQGPELFIPDSAGTVVSNSSLRGMGGKSGDTFVIDARGADQAGIARLEGAIMALHGSVERRSVNAVVAAIRKGGATGRALSGA